MKLAGKIVLGVLVLGMIGAALDDDESTEQIANEEPTTRIEERQEDYTYEIEEEKEEPKQEVKVPMEHQQALKKAQSYVRHQNFSKEGLKGQLEYHEFSSEAIQYALDNVEADWYQEARDHAESYTRHMSFSKQDLYDQLIYEGYTADEAQQAVDYVYGE